MYACDLAPITYILMCLMANESQYILFLVKLARMFVIYLLGHSLWVPYDLLEVCLGKLLS